MKPLDSQQDVAGAAPTIASLWPVDHRMVDVGVTGVTDPDGDPVSVRITSIRQSEPVEGTGDGNTCPDASGEGDLDGAPSCRAQRRR